MRRNGVLLAAFGLSAMLLLSMACNLTSELLSRSAHVTVIPTVPLATPTTRPALPPTPTPLSGRFRIHSMTAAQSADGSWEVVGMLENGLPSAVAEVEISVAATEPEAEDNQGTTGVPLLSRIPSGAAVPFKAPGFGPFGLDTRFEAEVVEFLPVDVTLPELEVVASRLVMGRQEAFIVGRIVNHSDFSVTIEGVAAAVFDPNLKLASGDHLVIGSLAPGEDGPFRVDLGPASLEGAAHAIYLQAQFAAAGPDYALEVNSVSGFGDLRGAYHLIGEMRNAHGSPLRTRLLASIFDREGELLDVAAVDPAPSLNPGETIAFDLSSWGPLSAHPELQSQIETYVLQWDPLWTYELEEAGRDLPVEISQVEAAEGGLLVSGRVAAGQPEDIAVIVSVKDLESGALLGAARLLLEQEAGGSFQTFVATQSAFDPQGMEVRLRARALPAADS